MKNKERMTCCEKTMVFAGVMVLISVALNLAFGAWWLAFTAFIGVNMIQSQFTGFCPATLVMRRLKLCTDSGAASPKTREKQA